jgi:hypothetical protein
MSSNKPKSPPTPEDAAQRLIILKHIVASAFAMPPPHMLREMTAAWSEGERERLRQRAVADRDQLCQRLRQAGLWRHLTPTEQAFARCTMLTVPAQQLLDTTWRLEAVQTLMWALRMIDEMPPYDTSAEPALLKRVPSADVAAFVRSARLRDPADLERARATAEFWHWRSRTRELIERGDPFPADEKMKAMGFHSFDDVVRFSAREAAKEGTIPPCVDDDFPVSGKAYRDLSEEEWTQTRSITLERHFALNWLCGYAPGNRWDETPTDT